MFSLSPFAPENLVSRDRFSRPVPRQPAHYPHYTQAESGLVEIGPISDFKKKNFRMGLKSAHFQEYDFQESGEGDRFWKMGTHFQKRSSSFENGLCVTWSDSVYAQRICGYRYSLQWSKPMARSHADS